MHCMTPVRIASRVLTVQFQRAVGLPGHGVQEPAHREAAQRGRRPPAAHPDPLQPRPAQRQLPGHLPKCGKNGDWKRKAEAPDS